jgi:hypothetical protein
MRQLQEPRGRLSVVLLPELVAYWEVSELDVSVSFELTSVYR